MKTIKIPDGAYNTVLCALHEVARTDAESGYKALSARIYNVIDEIEMLNNATNDDDLPMGVSYQEDGCVCHCDQRDAHEIALYLSPDELLAISWAMKRITFGDIGDRDVVHIWQAGREIADTISDRLGGPDLE